MLNGILGGAPLPTTLAKSLPEWHLGEVATRPYAGYHPAPSTKYLRGKDHTFMVAGLHRFGEHLSGGPLNLLVFRNLLEVADPVWLLEIFYLYNRLNQLFNIARHSGTTSTTGIDAPTHPWHSGAQTIVSSICSRDPSLLTQWAHNKMSTMRLFGHRKFLRLLGSFLRSYVSLVPSPSSVLGFYLTTTGKISVTGNAMSRTMFVRFGKAGVNNLSYRASSSFALIRTKTGCLGLTLTYFY
jgi:hypothetical protein